ncbi:glycosyltransferase [Aquimarina litoralis]|uniref:glycosyltransferase n=1 Tax=Aquimarina litoralis TaxID=584605 RepID=UPI001C561E53|nr:glycosyltransferase [Aquimarina litoralis]MBW1293912.1 glycosyltransferase [Aquimarina litoralis]
MQSKIVVLIPYYENRLGVINTINSIQESFPVDLMIVDDGSIREPLPIEEIQKTYGKRGKITYEILSENKGIEIALNAGLRKISEQNYTYIGRLDCGDRFHKDKLKKQITYLEVNKNIKLLGCWADIKDDQGKFLYIEKHPTSYDEIKKKMYLNTTFIHPSVVFESSILSEIGLYPIAYPAAEDYAFFMNIVKKYKSENYPEVLMDYIVDPNSISSLKRKRQVKSRIKVILNNYYLGWYPSYGLLRNLLLLLVSRKTSNKIKSIIRK